VERDAPLSATSIEGGIRIHLEHTGLLPLFTLSRIARARVEQGALCLYPDIPVMGRISGMLETNPGLREASSISPAFAQAVRQVAQRRGQVVLLSSTE